MDAGLFDNLCNLARLSQPEGERAEFQAKFADLLTFVERINAYAGKGGDPLVYKEALDAAPDEPEPFSFDDRSGLSFKVPSIIDFGG
jgi:Asp-tRNA(Asn)/Glu-tRNA(Gln) amidotransferase C subunit